MEEVKVKEARIISYGLPCVIDDLKQRSYVPCASIYHSLHQQYSIGVPPLKDIWDIVQLAGTEKSLDRQGFFLSKVQFIIL